VRKRLLLAVPVVLVLAAPASASLIWGQFNSPELTQEIMDLCYGGEEPPGNEIDLCGCEAAGWTWTGDDCIDPA
jgi:hypothetical protein